MGILLALLELAFIIVAIGLGMWVIIWALGLAGISVHPNIIKLVGALIVIAVLIWFVSQLASGAAIQPRLFR
jgi:hypothetical protein